MSNVKCLEKSEALKSILKEKTAVLDISEIKVDYDTEVPANMNIIGSEDTSIKGEHGIGFCTAYVCTKDIDRLIIVREWTDHLEEFVNKSKSEID